MSELANRIRLLHQRVPGWIDDEDQQHYECERCEESWPCLPVRAADHIAALEAENAQLREAVAEYRDYVRDGVSQEANAENERLRAEKDEYRTALEDVRRDMREARSLTSTIPGHRAAQRIDRALAYPLRVEQQRDGEER